MIRTLAKCIREYKLATILTPIFILCESLLEVYLPYRMADMIDYFSIKNPEMKQIIIKGLILLGIAFSSLLFSAFAGKYAAVASAGFAKNLRHDMFYKVQTFSFANIDKFSAASLVTRMTTDVTNIQNSFQMILRMAVRAPSMMIFAMIMSFRVNYYLSWIFVIFIPVIALALFIIIKFAHPIFTKVFKVYDKLNNIVQENLHGIRVVKSFVREEHETEKFKSISQQIYDSFSKAEKLIAFNMPVMQICIYSCIMIISWFAAQFIVDGTMTTGELVSMMTYIMQILMSLMFLSIVMVMVVISRASAERVAEVLNEKLDLTNCDEPVKEIPDGSVKFENVSFSYAKDEEKLCLKDVNIEIKSGETVGIIGGTGSGKTSIVNMIAGFYTAQSGKVLYKNKHISDYPLKQLRDSFGIVPQKAVLFKGTLRDNIKWGCPDANDTDIVKALDTAQAKEIFEQKQGGLDFMIEQGGKNLSGGQRQRLTIARAVIKQPEILILDDSSSALDYITDSKLRKAIRNIDPSPTVFLVSQRTSSVMYADKILVIDDGRIVGQGRHDDLLKSCDIYKEIYDSQFSKG